MSAGLQGFIQGISSAASQAADRKYQEGQDNKKAQWSLYSKVAYDNRTEAEGGPSDAERKHAMDQVNKLGGKDVKAGNQKLSSFRSMLDAITGKGGQQPQGQPQGQPGAQPQQQGAQGQGHGPVTVSAGDHYEVRSIPASEVEQYKSQGWRVLDDQPAQPQARGPLPAPQPPAQAQPQGGGMTENMPNGQPAPGTAGSKPMQRGGPLAAPQMPPVPTEGDIEGAKDRSSQAEAKRQSAAGQVERDRRTKLVKDWDLKGRDAAEFIEAGKLPASGVTTGTRKAEQWELPDGTKQDIDYDSKAGVRYDSKGEVWDVPEGAKRVAAPKSSGQLRQLKDAVTVADARKRHADGQIFRDVDGKEVDLDKLPDNNVLEMMETGDGKIVYTPGSPKESTFTVGNKVYARTGYNSSLTGTGDPNAPKDLGVARTGSTGTNAQLAVDPSTNKLTVNTLPHTNTPVTPGAQPAQGAQPQPNAPGAATAQPKRGPLAAPPAAQQQAPPQAKSDTGGATLRGAPVAMFNQQTQKAVPLMESVSQVFGDPAHPEIKPLLGYADMADNPKSSERLGKALKLTMDSLADVSGGGNVAVGAGPVSVNSGGFGQWLQNALGVTQDLARQHAQIMNEAVKDLTPEEREAYDAEMTAFSTAVGLRSLTKASAAQGSVKAIERELPLIGVNVASKKQFYDQMQRLAELSINGVRTFPNVNGAPVGFDKGLADRINGMPAELKRLKDASGQSKRGPLADPSGKKPAAPKAGDIQDGYRFKGGDPAKQENWEPVKGKAAA